jgi:tRNA threonylcarbamoyladenosine biosynthesis protein TsaB
MPSRERHISTLLAFDTSSERISVALGVDERVYTHEASGGAQASATLIPAILGLLSRSGITLGDLDAIGFGRGPGAFTGLRVACAVAQGLALGAHKPVLALDTLMAVAEDARQQFAFDEVWSAIDARMDEIYAGAYVYAEGRWRVSHAPALYEVDALNALWAKQPARAVAGNVPLVFGERLLLPHVQLATAAWPSAAALIALARAAWSDGHSLDAALALPLYLRDKVASTTAEREVQRAAKAPGPSMPAVQAAVPARHIR